MHAQLYIDTEPQPFGQNPPTWRCDALVLGLADKHVDLMIDNSQDEQINAFQRSLCTAGAVVAIINATVQRKGQSLCCRAKHCADTARFS